MISPQSAGGLAHAKVQRKQALDNYYADPNLCLHCDSIIMVADTDQVTAVRKKKFCNKSCAASYNNARSPKRIAISSSNCVACNELIIFTKKNGGGYNNRSYCDSCLVLKKTSQIIGVNLSAEDLFLCQTKSSLRLRRKDCKSFHSTLRTHSRQVYISSGRPMECEICGYSKYVEVCHIRAVKDFPDDATVLEINALSNLKTLCPTHHWEFDNGILLLE
jgi:hypothetical protein